jgi:hypothetical protein
MPMLKFTLTDHPPIWIDPDKVVAVGMNMSFGGGGAPGPGSTLISTTVGPFKNQSRTSLPRSEGQGSALRRATNQDAHAGLIRSVATHGGQLTNPMPPSDAASPETTRT